MIVLGALRIRHPTESFCQSAETAFGLHAIATVSRSLQSRFSEHAVAPACCTARLAGIRLECGRATAVLTRHALAPGTAGHGGSPPVMILYCLIVFTQSRDVLSNTKHPDRGCGSCTKAAVRREQSFPKQQYDTLYAQVRGADLLRIPSSLWSTGEGAHSWCACT